MDAVEYDYYVTYLSYINDPERRMVFKKLMECDPYTIYYILELARIGKLEAMVNLVNKKDRQFKKRKDKTKK